MCDRSRSICKGNGHQRQAWRPFLCSIGHTPQSWQMQRSLFSAQARPLPACKHRPLIQSPGKILHVAFHYYFCHKPHVTQTTRKYSIPRRIPTRTKDTSHGAAAPQAVHSSKSHIEASKNTSKSARKQDSEAAHAASYGTCESSTDSSATEHLFFSTTASDGFATDWNAAAKSDRGLTSSRTSSLMARRATSCSSLPGSSARDVSSSSATCQRKK
jgi:hypothetical protein